MSDNAHLREQILATCRKLESTGLNRGTSGNVSARVREGMLITPSGQPVETMTPASLVTLSLDGQILSSGKPSSEWHFHCDILASRPEIHAVVHTHSPHATALACLREDLPPFHYMIAIAGGDSIRCAPYALFGTEALSQHAVAALKGRKACLLANHGLIALGRDLDEALAIAVEIESLCEQYLIARQVGQPVLLSATAMRDVIERFQHYGRNAVTS